MQCATGEGRGRMDEGRETREAGEGRRTRDEGRRTKDKASLVLVSKANNRPSSVELSVRPVDEHGEASGADDLFFSFVKTGQVHPVFVIRSANEALKLFRGHANPPAR